MRGAGDMLGGTPLERAKRTRKDFKGRISLLGGEVAGIVLGVPQHASLFSLAADILSPTTLVPIFSLD